MRHIRPERETSSAKIMKYSISTGGAYADQATNGETSDGAI
jgi:hypothetical protein